MNKKTFTAAIIMLALISFTTSIKNVRAAEGDIVASDDQPPKITFLSPVSTGSFNKNYFPIIVTVEIFGYTTYAIQHLRYVEYNQSAETLNSLNCSLDGNPYAPMQLTIPSVIVPHYYAVGTASLTQVPDGAHNITIQGQTTNGDHIKSINANLTFVIDTKPIPSISPSPSPTLSPSPSPSSIPSPSPTQNPSPSIPEFPTWIIPTLTLTTTLIAAITVRRRKLIEIS